MMDQREIALQAISTLNQGELDVLVLSAKGLSNAEAARRCGVGDDGGRYRRRRILEKLSCDAMICAAVVWGEAGRPTEVPK